MTAGSSGSETAVPDDREDPPRSTDAPPFPADAAGAAKAAAPAVMIETAPVLMLPEVFDPALCARLMTAFESDHFESGFPRLVDGVPRLLPDPALKLRRDHRLTDGSLVDTVTSRIVERILPAVMVAFNYEVTSLEGFKVVRYDAATGGYFRAHRDNVTPDAQHRRFALTINLNDDYEGGGLTFPEFGARRYRPPAGGAIAFSGGLLHAACDVTTGRRYALLTFMWGDR